MAQKIQFDEYGDEKTIFRKSQKLIKKPFTISKRIKPEFFASSTIFKQIQPDNDWIIHGRYVKEKDRDKALKVLNKEDGFWEFEVRAKQES